MNSFKKRLEDFGELEKIVKLKLWQFTEDFMNGKREDQENQARTMNNNNIVMHKVDQYGKLRLMPNPTAVKNARNGSEIYKINRI